ncbi:MAG: hypothetical protein ACHQ53_17540, partial [Polyangiales bacterium]
MRTSACRAGVHGAIGTIAGIVLSGPLAVALVNTTHPQPPWGGPALFARSFHPIQVIPYPGGIFLVAGVVLLIASVRGLAQPAQQILADVALVFCAVFATLVFLNYIVQTTYVPVLARDYTEATGSILTLFSMSNPKSLAWALEMWG